MYDINRIGQLIISYDSLNRDFLQNYLYLSIYAIICTRLLQSSGANQEDFLDELESLDCFSLREASLQPERERVAESERRTKQTRDPPRPAIPDVSLGVAGTTIGQKPALLVFLLVVMVVVPCT